MYSGKLKSSLLLTFQIILLNELSPNSVRGRRHERIAGFHPPPSGYVPFPKFEVAYKMSNSSSLTWVQARDYCFQHDAKLAITDTLAKIDAIIHMNPKTRYFHIGFFFSPIFNKWVRVGDAKKMARLPWLQNYPMGNGNCAGVDTGKRSDRQNRGLVNYECEQFMRAFVCEVKLIRI